MKKVLFFVAFILIFFSKSCHVVDRNYIESGDFLYLIVTPKNDEVDRKPFVRIMGLSETGKEKEIIIVPQFIDGIEVKEIGRNVWGQAGEWYTENLKRVFIPFLPDEMSNFIRSTNYVTVLMFVNEIPDENHSEQEVYITSYHSTAGNTWYQVPSEYSSGAPACHFANVSYFYNYDEAPNCGYYWIDNYDYGNIISYIPENPIREGYIFDGWYKESECINEWDFENDKLPSAIYNEDNWPNYQETRLYAKWIKEE